MGQKNSSTVGMTNFAEETNKVMSALSSLMQDNDDNDDKFPSDEYEWFFLDQNNTWTKYGHASSGNDASTVPSQGSDDIEKHYQSRPDQLMSIKSRQHSYELNFKTMIQTNLSTKVQRPMRRTIKNSGSNGGNIVSVKLNYEWFFKEDNGSWVKIGSKGDSDVTSAIENHYQTNPTTKFKFTAGNQSYLLDFTNMTQTNTTTGKVRNVYRRENITSMQGATSGSANAASYQAFNDIPKGQAYSVTTLKPNQTEYDKILSLLRSHIPNCNPIAIHKILNPYLKRAFYNNKAKLENRFPDVKYKDEWLFHGTDSANVKPILEDNFDWRLHGTNVGQLYGQGAYFSNNAAMSRKYGNAIFICGVLVGLTALGDKETIRPPKDKFVPSA
ncbi:protein mono-ADP-ribosyltransferase PARP11-like [Hyalella azteca]|uniref:Poly [ADP-ribose] polymerase n=1 Tax=Hyalella azteca TaxID=294128 RepID=A0A8B7P1F1_HYAAZ|nr:protein mono-ADP-ribosyltransferase PARP11-like [Hyalella azteca]